MDDPINPAHYGGTACAQIGERLSANSYQVLKYNWRLGKKDTATIEVGKSIWYLDREIVMAKEGILWIRHSAVPRQEWFEERLFGQSNYVKSVTYDLINFNRTGEVTHLHALRVDLTKMLTTLEENN